MPKRSRDKIISQILDICVDGATKTRIVYLGNLNFKTAEPYLKFLVKKGFLVKGKESRAVYTTSKKGTDLLETFKAIQAFLSETGYTVPDRK
jgi:predicted transcriptional regulator